MELDQNQLVELALSRPWWMFTGQEIAMLCNVSSTFVSLVKQETDSPFCVNKCRPEWFAEWMRVHPHFQLRRGPQENLSKKIGPHSSQSISTHPNPSKTVKRRPGPK